MRWSTPLLVLFCNRKAIIDAAVHWRTSLVLGATMIVSSGLARNYDAADLVREPWHLLLPYIASTGTATLLFLLWKVIRAFRKAPLPWRMFPPFLGLYWLTAPVAWLYGVPYEEFQSPADAVGSNALTLLIVAGWRVSIITSVVSLGLGTPRLQTFLIDLAYGWTLIVIASYLDPRPILLDMGGIRADPSMVAWGNILLLTRTVGTIGAFILCVTAIILAWQIPLHTEESTRWIERAPRKPVFSKVLLIGIAAILLWTPPTLVMQPKQKLRVTTERLIGSGDYRAALQLMSRHQQGDYPPHWKPTRDWSASRSFDENDKIAMGLIESANDLYSSEPPPEWARNVMIEYAQWGLQRHTWQRLSDNRYVVSPDLATGPYQEIRTVLVFLLKHDAGLSEDDRQNIAASIAKIEHFIALPTKR